METVGGPMHESLEGGCACARLRFRITSAPIVVNCCHCRDCQRLTGSAFAVNAMIETARVEVLGGWLDRDRAGADPGGRRWRCADCGVLLYKDHRLFGDAMRFVRVGTLDHGERLSPDVHFFVRSKHPWVTIPDGVPQYETLPADGAGVDLAAAATVRLRSGLRDKA